MRAFLLSALALASCSAPLGPTAVLEPPRSSSLASAPRFAAPDARPPGPGRPPEYHYGASSSGLSDGRATRSDAGHEVFVGFRSFPRESFGRVRNQTVGGFNLLFPLADGPVAIELGTAYSSDKVTAGNSSVFEEASALEASLGLRLAADLDYDILIPFVGAGLTTLHLQLDDEVLNERRYDTTIGFYARAGLAFYWDVNRYLTLEWRSAFGTEADLLSSRASADYNQITLAIGLGW